MSLDSLLVSTHPYFTSLTIRLHTLYLHSFPRFYADVCSIPYHLSPFYSPSFLSRFSHTLTSLLTLPSTPLSLFIWLLFLHTTTIPLLSCLLSVSLQNHTPFFLVILHSSTLYTPLAFLFLPHLSCPSLNKCHFTASTFSIRSLHYQLPHFSPFVILSCSTCFFPSLHLLLCLPPFFTCLLLSSTHAAHPYPFNALLR